MVAAGTAWHNVVERLHRYIVSVLHAKHTHAKSVIKPYHARANICLGMVSADAHTHMHECQKAIHGLVSRPSYWFDAFKARGSVKFGTEKLKKKTHIAIAPQATM